MARRGILQVILEIYLLKYLSGHKVYYCKILQTAISNTLVPQYRHYFATSGENGALKRLLKTAVLYEEISARFLVDLFNVTASACSSSEDLLMLDILRDCVLCSQYVQFSI